VRDFEPHAALFASRGGLSEIRKLLEELPRAIVAGGAFLFEFGFGQARAVAEEIRARNAWELRRIVPDLAAIPRVAVLRRANLAR
jgi:methylase of polypeptide subunit release factors